MGMVFCRGCGKEIHETAPTCPHCGAPQRAVEGLGGRRSIAKLIGWGFVWAMVFWATSLFLLGAIVGAMNPQDAVAAGSKAGESMGGLFLLIAIGLSIVLTITGKLPGTKKS